MHATAVENTNDECYRCGYDLRGFADEQACPECGLLAQRSRRESDELHDTRPRWLRSLSWGINLILLAMIAPIATPLLATAYLYLSSSMFWSIHMDLCGLDSAAILVFLGVFLLTSREGYPPADRADRWLRMWLRRAALAPVAGMILIHIEIEFVTLYRDMFSDAALWIGPIFLSIVLAALPLLLFLRLRGLAKRVRSAHLAEHCLIVGIGASASMLYVIAAVVILNYQSEFGLNYSWNTQLIMELVLGVASILFILWTLYLLICFAIAFWIAARKLRRKWTRDDRSAI